MDAETENTTLTLDSIVDARLTERDPQIRDLVIINSIGELNANGYTQVQLNGAIDGQLQREQLFLNTELHLSRNNNFAPINIYRLKAILETLRKPELLTDFLQLMTLALEVHCLNRQMIGPVVSQMIAGGMDYIKQNCPEVKVFSFIEKPHFGLTLHLKSLMFVNRSFLDKMLVVLNQLNFILCDPNRDRGVQPSTRIDKFYVQYLTRKLDHLDERILQYFDREIVDMLSSRFVRNNLKLASDLVYNFAYEQGEAYVKGTIKPVKKDDNLLDELIASGHVSSAAGLPVGKERVTLKLPESIEYHDQALKQFINVVYDVLVDRVNV